MSVLAAALITSAVGLVEPAVESRRAPQLSYPEELVEGDIVFRTGSDALSGLVLAHSKGSRFSHVGVLVRIADQWLIIHSTPAESGAEGGVHTESLEAFASSEGTQRLGVYRIDEMSSRQRQSMKDYLLSQQGKPFDYRFQYSDNSAHYCTELVLKALDHAGVNLEPAMRRVHVLTLTEAAIPPDSLAWSSHLREVTPNPPMQRTAFGNR